MITANKSVQIASDIQAQQREVDALVVQKLSEGFVFAGHNFQIDQAALQSMTAIFVLLVAGVPNPHGGFWRSSDNVNVPMNDTVARTFILAAKAYVQSLLASSWTLKDTLKTLTSLPSIAAYDITAASSWPAND